MTKTIRKKSKTTKKIDKKRKTPRLFKLRASERILLLFPFSDFKQQVRDMTLERVTSKLIALLTDRAEKGTFDPEHEIHIYKIENIFYFLALTRPVLLISDNWEEDLKKSYMNMRENQTTSDKKTSKRPMEHSADIFFRQRLTEVFSTGKAKGSFLAHTQKAFEQWMDKRENLTFTPPDLIFEQAENFLEARYPEVASPVFVDTEDQELSPVQASVANIPKRSFSR